MSADVDAYLFLTEAISGLRQDIRELRTDMGTMRTDVASVRETVALVKGHLEGEEIGLKKATDTSDRDAERADRVAKRVTDRADRVADRVWRGRSLVVEVATAAAVMLSAYAAFLH